MAFGNSQGYLFPTQSDDPWENVFEAPGRRVTLLRDLAPAVFLVRHARKQASRPLL